MASSSDVVLTPGASKKLNCGRKRKLNLQEWKCNKRKQLRNSGQQYTASRGKEVQGKTQMRWVE